MRVLLDSGESLPEDARNASLATNLVTSATRTLVVVFVQLKQLAQPVKGALQARGTTTRTTAANAAAAMPRELFKASVTSRRGSVDA